MKDYYKILEISANASQDQIKEQYRFLAHAWHPDKFPNARQKPYAEAKMKEVNEAYEVLGDPEKRERYDKERRHQFSTHHEQDQFREKERAAHREAEERAELEKQKREQAKIEKQRRKQAEKERKEAEQKEISKYWSWTVFWVYLGFVLIFILLLVVLKVNAIWVTILGLFLALLAAGFNQDLAEARWRAEKERNQEVSCRRKWPFVFMVCVVLLWGFLFVFALFLKTRLLFVFSSFCLFFMSPLILSSFFRKETFKKSGFLAFGFFIYSLLGFIITQCLLIYLVVILGFGLEKLIAKANSPIVSERLTVASKLDNMLEWSNPRDHRITDILVKLSTDSDSKVRENAIMALGRAGDPNRLIAALKDPVGDVRNAAARFLGEIKDPKARQALAEIAASDPDSEVRKEARRALGRLPKESPAE